MKRNFFNNCKIFLTVAETSNKLYLSKKTIYRMIHQNKLEYLKIGGVYFIKTSSLKSLIEVI